MFGPLDRRKLVQRLAQAGGAAALAATVAPRGSAAQDGSTDGASTPSATPAGAGWTFTDYLGRDITLPAPPTRIASEIGGAAALYDMGVQVACVWGAPANDPAGYAEAWGRLPVESVANISTSDGSVDLEMAIAAGVDLFVLGSTEREDPDSYGGFDDIASSLLRIAPIAAWPFRERLDETTAGIWDLAIALGADPESEKNTAARAAMDAAVADLQGILAEKPDLTTFFGYPTPNELYVANPENWDDVNYFRSLGLNVVELDESFLEDYWEILSWEQALTYETDTVFLANVEGALTAEELAVHPTFRLHPAMQAGQNGIWSWYFARSPQGITTLVENVAAVLRTAEVVTGQS